MPLSMRNLAAALASACALAAVPGPARAWNAGTHLSIAEKLLAPSTSDRRLLWEAAYGANALDLFNNDFSHPSVDLANWLHDPGSLLFMDVWQLAATHSPLHRAFAFGVVSHNDAWGSDATAHLQGLTSGPGVGWVIERGVRLGARLDPILRANGMVLTPAQLADIGHNLIEQAVDLRMLEVDPDLGAKLMASAAARNPSDPAMLEVAWSRSFAAVLGSDAAAVQTIRGYELASREGLVAYGWALSQPDALEQVSRLMAQVGASTLGLPAEQLVPLIVAGLGIALQEGYVAGFEEEIARTVDWVAAGMAANGVVF